MYFIVMDAVAEIETEAVSKAVLIQEFAGKEFEVEAVSNQVAQGNGVAKIEGMIIKGMSVIQQNIIDLAAAVGFIFPELRQFSIGSGIRFSPTIVVSSATNIITELAVLPPCAQRLPAFEAKFFVGIGLKVFHLMIGSAWIETFIID